MDDDDFDVFVEDIRTNGQLVPIWIRGSEVIDGRKRLAACERLGVAPKTVNLSPEQDAESVARALNVLRTHYTPSQRAAFASERPLLHVGRVSSQVDTKNTDHAPISVRQAATEAGVAQSAVSKAKKVREIGAPEVFDAVKRGSLTLHAAEQIVDAVPMAEQSATVERVIEASKGKARHTPVAKVLGTDGDPRRDRAMPKPAHEQFARAVQSMEVLVDVIAKNADAALHDARRKGFLESLRHIRTALTRAINTMEAAA